jgi:chloramphenicol 3-O-phosphotransferase
MDLVFLHGASAVGKLTVAKALLEMLPARLFDNHSAIDLALTVFDFGTPGFWRLVDEIRVTTLDIAAAHDVGLIVTTFCYADPGDRSTLERFEQILERHRGRLLPVFLHCEAREAERRVGNADRVARGKLSSIEKLRLFNAQADFTAVPRPQCLSLDTGKQTPQEAAARIVQHFELQVESPDRSARGS